MVKLYKAGQATFMFECGEWFVDLDESCGYVRIKDVAKEELLKLLDSPMNNVMGFSAAVKAALENQKQGIDSWPVQEPDPSYW